MPLPFDYELKVVAGGRAVHDFARYGGAIKIPVDSGGGPGHKTIRVPLEMPHIPAALIYRLIEFVNVQILAGTDEAHGVDWTVTGWSLDEAYYLYFTIYNHTVGQQGEEGEYVAAVERRRNVGR